MTDKIFTSSNREKSTKGKKSKKQPISFPSDIVGEHIRNAMTGSYYEERVGSLDEKRFFKVSSKSSVKFNSEGTMIAEGYDMSCFFYETPEQYEKHKNVVLEQSVKDEWYNKSHDYHDVKTDDM